MVCLKTISLKKGIGMDIEQYKNHRDKKCIKDLDLH
jgi:hypothetical protein